MEAVMRKVIMRVRDDKSPLFDFHALLDVQIASGDYLYCLLQAASNLYHLESTKSNHAMLTQYPSPLRTLVCRNRRSSESSC